MWFTITESINSQSEFKNKHNPQPSTSVVVQKSFLSNAHAMCTRKQTNKQTNKDCVTMHEKTRNTGHFCQGKSLTVYIKLTVYIYIYIYENSRNKMQNTELHYLKRSRFYLHLKRLTLARRTEPSLAGIEQNCYVNLISSSRVTKL